MIIQLYFTSYYLIPSFISTYYEFSKPDQLVDDIIEQVILTIELWYNRCIQSCNLVTSSSSNLSTLIEHKSLCTTASMTDYGRNELSLQLTSVILSEHPVYKLMYKRAMDFLRSALSSYPPEPLPLPPGFSVLLDLDQDKLSSSTNENGTTVNSVGYLRKPPLNIPTTMMSGGSNTTTGLLFHSSPSSPHKESIIILKLLNLKY
ncbi:unnamed protein product [Schistosoma mattheei]|uniref:Uncharacterized protein n=1 Tax=Schistosoma mattheei TaxID=31246 RepID=A0AA85AT31_9TREM|nr:unnamed protein product [Schistosoma mattheei]